MTIVWGRAERWNAGGQALWAPSCRVSDQLLDLLHRAVALQARQVVDEQHAFQVVHLVLDAHGVETLGLLFDRLALIVQVGQPDLGRALDRVIDLRHRQAAFLVGEQLLGGPDDLGIDEVARLGLLALLGQVHDDHAHGLAFLHGGLADAGCVVLGLLHFILLVALGFFYLVYWLVFLFLNLLLVGGVRM